MTNYPSAAFLDVDGLGYPSGRLSLIETLAQSSNSREVGSTIGNANWSTDPINQYPIPDPGAGNITFDGIDVRRQTPVGGVANWLIDWAFTYK